MVVDYIKNSNMLRLRYTGNMSKETSHHIYLSNMNEFLRMYRSASWYRIEDDDNSDDLYTPYVEKAKEVFDQLVNKRKNKIIAEVDFSKTFESPVAGTSKLIHRPNVGTITIVFRRGKSVTTSNCVCIDDRVREEFFAECKASPAYKKGKYVISKEDETLYRKWVNLMNKEYISQYLKEVH